METQMNLGRQVIRWPSIFILTWVVCIQAAVLVFVKNEMTKLSAILAIASALTLGLVLFFPNRKRCLTLVVLSVVCIMLSWLSYPAGQEQYIITSVMQKHGYDVTNPQDKERYLDDINTGKLNVLNMLKEIDEAAATPPSTTGVLVFKTKRYVWRLIWPRLQFLAEQSIK